MNFEKRRQAIIDKMADNSIAILYSGAEHHVSADEYDLFTAQCNRNFFYLTGLRRENMALVINKTIATPTVTLFIEPFDEYMQRWYGKKVTKEEAIEISGIKQVAYVDSLESTISGIMANRIVENAYFDCYRHSTEDLPDYNNVKATEFSKLYPGVKICNLFPMVAELRMVKDEDEVELIKTAIGITDKGLQNVLKNLKPGLKEYQVQADFEYVIARNGSEHTAFPTIAGSGINGTMLHYDTNQEEIKDNTLILLDLGARYKGYNADITRTYPANGKFTERQRQVYDIVLNANREVLKQARSGMTIGDLQEICKKVLADGLIELGLIKEASELSKYYMHGVSHHLGIDVHDVNTGREVKLMPGAVITDEPGLYIDEWEIGIRIEDDLLIQEDSAICLSQAIIRDPDEIEKYMAENKIQ